MAGCSVSLPVLRFYHYAEWSIKKVRLPAKHLPFLCIITKKLFLLITYWVGKGNGYATGATVTQVGGKDNSGGVLYIGFIWCRWGKRIAWRGPLRFLESEAPAPNPKSGEACTLRSRQRSSAFA